MLPPQIRVVLFDAVGTVIHPAVPAPAKYAEVAVLHGLPLTAEIVRERFVTAFREQERLDRAANWRTSEQREEERWRAIVTDTLTNAERPQECFHTLYDHYATPAAWHVDANLEPLLQELQSRGIHVGLASNYDRRLRDVVAGHPPLQQFEPHVYISSEIGHRKPGAGFFQRLVDGFPGISPEEIAFVGDDVENDYDGATANGFHAILLDAADRYATLRRVRSLAELLR